MTPPKFAVIGDPHIVDLDYTTTKGLRDRVEALNQMGGLEYVFVTGDIAHNGLPHQYELAKNILDKLDAKYFCCTGNHDTIKGVQYEQYIPVFGVPHYSTTIGDYNLLIIEHRHPPCLWGFSVDTSKPAIALKHDAQHPDLPRYFKKHNVKLVIQGHYHRRGIRDEVIDGIRHISCPAYFLGIGTLSTPITYKNLSHNYVWDELDDST